MNKNKMYDAVGEIPDIVVHDSEKFHESKKKQRRGRMIKIGSLAACFCIIVTAVIGILLHQNAGIPDDTATDSKYNIISTEGFQGLFFGLTQSATEPEGGPAGIWANPVRPGYFRTSITLGSELETSEDGKYFALVVDFAVSGESKDEALNLSMAYEFFKAQGFEAGIIDGKLYLAATKAQIKDICGKSPTADSVGAEFKLANPTEEQKALESQIRY